MVKLGNSLKPMIRKDSLYFYTFQYADPGIDTNSPMGVLLLTILGALSQLERELIKERVVSGMRNAKLKGVRIGRVRKRNDTLIHSLLDAGLSFREISRISKSSHGSISASKKELLAKRAEAQKNKIEELSKVAAANTAGEMTDQLKNMNISEEIVEKVQAKLESDARENIRAIQGVAYETYD